MIRHRLPSAFRRVSAFDLKASGSGRVYRIFVYTPDVPPPAAGYPVVILTDGEITFATAADSAALRQRGELRPALIVGIGYPDATMLEAMTLRNTDLSPEAPPQAVPIGLCTADGLGFGGAEAFYHFLVDDLRPALAARTPVDPADQTLFGHSLGGLFTLTVLFEHPKAFRTYVASSPSIWWNDRALLAGEAALARRIGRGDLAPRLLLTAGDEEGAIHMPLPPRDAGAGPRMVDIRMIAEARDLAARLSAAVGTSDAKVAFHLFPGENHVSVIPAAIARALSFALRVPLAV